MVAQLDRERQQSHLLTVAAVDSGSPAQTGTASLLISVEDVNDSPPSLDEASRELSVLENSPPNTLVARLLPTDPDLPPNTAPFTFSISGGRDSQLFSIDQSSGELRSLVRLDREAVTPSLQVEVTIKDGGSPPQQASYPLTVVVEDENDNPPRLTNNPGSLTIPDNAGPGDFLYKLEVRDEDSGANSQLQYFLLGEAGRFSLDQNTGVLTSRSNVDNEGEVFSLEVKVSDSGVPSLSDGKRMGSWPATRRSTSPLTRPCSPRTLTRPRAEESTATGEERG